MKKSYLLTLFFLLGCAQPSTKKDLASVDKSSSLMNKKLLQEQAQFHLDKQKLLLAKTKLTGNLYKAEETAKLNYESALRLYKLKQYNLALVKLDNVIRTYPYSVYSRKSMWIKGVVLENLNKQTEADENWRMLKTIYPHSQEAKFATNQLNVNKGKRE